MKKYYPGDSIPLTGEYQCAECGYIKELEKDDIFSECENCYSEDMEWEITEK